MEGSGRVELLWRHPHLGSAVVLELTDTSAHAQGSSSVLHPAEPKDLQRIRERPPSTKDRVRGMVPVSNLDEPFVCSSEIRAIAMDSFTAVDTRMKLSASPPPPSRGFLGTFAPH